MDKDRAFKQVFFKIILFLPLILLVFVSDIGNCSERAKKNPDNGNGTFIIRRQADEFPKNMKLDEESGGDLFWKRNNEMKKIARQIEQMKGEPGVPLSRMPSIWPVEGYITSHFGPRNSPFTGKRRMHAGMDIGAPSGTPIIAPADGIVIFSGRGNGYGEMIEIYHARGMVTRYAHMSKRIAKSGWKVKRGEIIGLVGSTGRSTGPHLHYEVLLSGLPTNPLRHISKQPRRAFSER